MVFSANLWLFCKCEVVLDAEGLSDQVFPHSRSTRISYCHDLHLLSVPSRTLLAQTPSLSLMPQRSLRTLFPKVTPSSASLEEGVFFFFWFSLLLQRCGEGDGKINGELVTFLLVA